jgi:hypothetical protein
MHDLWRYLRTQAWPRRRDILRQGQVAAAVVAGIIVAIVGDRLGLDDVKVDVLVTAVFAYAALALGACLTGLTVALTLPDRSFALYLAAAKREDKPEANAYHDLVFVFSWTALAHWAVISLALVTFVGLGDQDVPTFAGDCSVGGALVVVLIAALVYAMAQFMVTIITLAEVAEVYINWMLKEKRAGAVGADRTSPPDVSPAAEDPVKRSQ